MSHTTWGKMAVMGLSPVFAHSHMVQHHLYVLPPSEGPCNFNICDSVEALFKYQLLCSYFWEGYFYSSQIS